MKVHILSGDSLSKPFQDTGIEGEVFVFRECLVDGPLKADGLDEFWALRGEFLKNTYGGENGDYDSKVTDEIVRFCNAVTGKKVYLWFEYELFCQVNFWFLVWLLRSSEAKLNVVYPAVADEKDIWKGFGNLDQESLVVSFEKSCELNEDDVRLAVRLWEAFRDRDFDELEVLGSRSAECFPTLELVTRAACEIETRPLRRVKRSIESGKTEFGDVFQDFCEQEGVYGFGDLQVKRIFDEEIGVI